MINHPNRKKQVETPTTINIDVARKVLSIVDAGLVKGVGKPVAGQMCVEAAVCFALGLPHGDDPRCVSRALRALKIKLNDSNWSSDKARAKGLRRLAVVQLGSRDALDDREFVTRVAKLSIQKSVPTALRAAASIQKDPVHKNALLNAANRCEKDGDHASAIEAQKIARDAAAAAVNAAAYAAYAAAYAADAAVNAAAYAAYAAAYAAYAYAAYVYVYADAYAYAYAAYADTAKAIARDKVLSDFAEGVVQILIDMKAPGCQWLELTEV